MKRLFQRRQKLSTTKTSSSPTSTITNASDTMATTEATVIAFTKEMNVKEFTTSADIVLLDFYADWCGPCRFIAPTVAKYAKDLTPLAEERKKKIQDSVAEGEKCTKPAIKFGKVDVDAFAEEAALYNVAAMPTILIFKDGELFKQIVGANPPAIEAALNEALDQKYGPVSA
eukprot:GFKZ01000465.1.p2 GENE.GFKZ01000465.1~~GFKZ01000465.1.p2  ORF type:complete len:172 (+),score=32.81 GFKZ01000465.1:353-868(+)